MWISTLTKLLVSVDINILYWGPALYLFYDDCNCFLGQILKYISSLSLPLAWFQLILLAGFHGWTISIMFVHIIHKR